MMNEQDKQELEEISTVVVEMVDNVIDKMIKNGTPKKIAQLARAYHEAFIEEGFPKDDAYKMVVAVLKSNSFNTNKS